jgi:hypothetical protein
MCFFATIVRPAPLSLDSRGAATFGQKPMCLLTIGKNGMSSLSRYPRSDLGSTNGPTKLECYIALGWKGLSVKNILAYWVHL